MDQLNIKNEIRLVSLFWFIASFMYFSFYEFKFSKKYNRAIILSSILVRDLGAFYS